MIGWIQMHRRSALLCGLTLLLPLLLYLRLLAGAWSLRAEYAGAIANLEPRIARMQGVLQVEEQLRSSAKGVQRISSSLVYPARADHASVAASLQSDVRQLMREAGLSVVDSQVLPVRKEETFDYIGVKLTVAGDLASLDSALAQLAEFKPLIIVESLEVWPSRQRGKQQGAEAQEATASLRLLSLRALQ